MLRKLKMDQILFLKIQELKGMRNIAACFLYVLCSIIYLHFGEKTRAWGGFNIFTQFAFIGYLCYLAEQNLRSTEFERLFFCYLKYLSVINCIYIVACVLKGRYWSIYNTDIFAYILGISVVVLLVHFAYIKDKNG